MRHKRLVAVAVALGMCAFLLGLSTARDALPGDMFQFVRSTPGHTTPAADLKPLKKLGGSPDWKPSAQHSYAITEDTTGLDHRLVPWPPVAPAASIHSGRCAGTPGCRGPPAA